MLEIFINFNFKYPLNKTIKINRKDINPSISRSFVILKKLNNVSKILLNRYKSGLIKKPIKGISTAIDIDSPKEANIDKINTTTICLFLFASKYFVSFLKIFIGVGIF